MIAFLVQRSGLIFPRQWPRRTAVYRGSAGRAQIKVRLGVLPANEPIWELTKVCRRRTPRKLHQRGKLRAQANLTAEPLLTSS
jgi:hypothetical protein